MQGYSPSPKATPHQRKSRPAPLPPAATQGTTVLSFSEAKHVVAKLEDLPCNPLQWEREKNKKDVTNRNRQSQTLDTFCFSKCSYNGRVISMRKVHRGNSGVCVCLRDHDCRGK